MGLHQFAKEPSLPEQMCEMVQKQNQKVIRHVIICVSKPIEYTTLRVNPDASCGLQVLMKCQHRFIDCNKCTTVEKDVNGGEHVFVGAGIYSNHLHFPFSFAVNLKLL